MRVVLAATVMTPEGAHNVRIRDISAFGAQVSGTHELPVNCDAVLKRGRFFAAARVVWSNNREAGLRFYRTLQPDEVDANSHGARPTQTVQGN